MSVNRRMFAIMALPILDPLDRNTTRVGSGG